MKREEGRGKREEGRGKREEGRGERGGVVGDRIGEGGRVWYLPAAHDALSIWVVGI